jgi:DNA polymerase elongation subunit (family B)
VLDERGKLLIKGSGLRSRGIEPFLRLWMEEMLSLLLTGRRDEISALLNRWEEDFRAHRVPLRHFMKTETLQDSPATYRQKLAAGARNVDAAYELAHASARSYQPGDQISYYVTGDSRRVKVNEAAKLAAEWSAAAPDENTAYYVWKLQELYEKFRPLIEQEGLAPVREDEAPPAPVQLSLYED